MERWDDEAVPGGHPPGGSEPSGVDPPGDEVPPGAYSPGAHAGPKAGSPGTGPLPLHPMLLSDILDGAFKLYRANAKALLAVAAVFIVPLQLLAAILGRAVVGPAIGNVIDDSLEDSDILLVEGAFSESVAEILSSLAVVAALPLVAGAVSVIVARSYLGGEMGAPEALSVVRRRWWPLAASWTLVHLVAVLGLLLCILPGLLLLALYIAVPAAVVVEGRGAVDSMRRSSSLVRQRLWPVLGIGLLAWLLDAVVSSALGWVIQLPSLVIPGGWLLRIAGAMAVNVITAPFVAIVGVLIYFDLRIRFEGFDLQVMADDVARRSQP